MAHTGWDGRLTEQIRQNGRLFFRLAYTVLRDAAAAEDACQQAFLRAWQERDRVGPEDAALKGWLARTVINNSLQVVRRAKVERRAVAARGYAAPASAGPAGEQDELREAVLAAVGRLPEPTRLVVALRVLEGMSGNDVRDLLGCSAAEVSRQLHRGLEQLRGLVTHRDAGLLG